MDHINMNSSVSLEVVESSSQVLLVTLYTATLILAVVANLLVIVFLWSNKRIMSPLRAFLINLAVADLTMALLTTPFTYTSYMWGRWIFPGFLCRPVHMAQLTTVTVSIYTLVAISLDRYMAIMYPLVEVGLWIRKKRHQVLALIWILGLLVGSTQLAVVQLTTFEYRGVTYVDCVEQWKPGTESGRLYTLFLFHLTFALPLLAMAILHGVLVRRLSLGTHNLFASPEYCLTTTFSFNTTLVHHERQFRMTKPQRRKKRIVSRRIKAIRMLIIVNVVFAICWLPIQLFQLVIYHQPSLLMTHHQSSHYNTFVGIYFVCHWLSMAHNFINPILYMFLSHNFKVSVKRLLNQTFKMKAMTGRLYSPSDSL